MMDVDSKINYLMVGFLVMYKVQMSLFFDFGFIFILKKSNIGKVRLRFNMSFFKFYGYVCL